MLPIKDLLRNSDVKLPFYLKETNPDDNNSLENDDWLGDR